MSRGRGAARGRGGGRGGFGGAGTLPPMGLSFADIQNLSRDPTQLYPPRDSDLPVLTESSEREKTIVKLQLGFIQRLRDSAYYVVERKRSNELPRYSDKYRPSTTQATLKKRDLNPVFFPKEVFEGYFNPLKKRKMDSKSGPAKRAINLDELDHEDNQEKSDNEHGSQASEEQEDYDVDEEYDNDYADNYFDNGENDDLDNLGDGGGDEGVGGGSLDYD